MVLRPKAAVRAERYYDLHLMVDFDDRTAHLDGAPLRLTHKTFCLLAFMIRHPGELVRRETLLKLVWGYADQNRSRTLDVHIRRLRKELGIYGNTYIETIFGIGYRFQPFRSVSPPEVLGVVSPPKPGPGAGNFFTFPR